MCSESVHVLAGGQRLLYHQLSRLESSFVIPTLPFLPTPDSKPNQQSRLRGAVSRLCEKEPQELKQLFSSFIPGPGRVGMLYVEVFILEGSLRRPQVVRLWSRGEVTALERLIFVTDKGRWAGEVVR